MKILNILEIIEKKRDKKELSTEEINFFIEEYTKGNIADYQASALIMAIYLNGMTEKETSDMTLAMAKSGEVLELSDLSENIVDKHSTGGVGDKVSLILLPLVASLGVIVAKMSGRGLGFTGGTVDKLESIPGYRTNIGIDEFKENVRKIGISMISQTANLAPADKKLYALRDSINCVESMPLIVSSIMSKKIASGAQKIVIEVTVGNGAFMKNEEDAKKLADEMIKIGKMVNREVVCILTKMDEPLGFAVGNNLEVIEAVKFLKGDMPEDLKQVVLELGSNMIKLAGLGNDLEKNKEMMLENISNGKGYAKFIEMVKTQGGDISYIENLDKFPKSKFIVPILSKNSGYITNLPAKEIGEMACFLGAGRISKDDKIDNSVGIVLTKKVGDFVKNNEVIAYIHSNDTEKAKKVEKDFYEICEIGNSR